MRITYPQKDDCIDLQDRTKGQTRMQDVYLNYCRKELMEVEFRLCDQTTIRGSIVGFDQQVIVLERQGSQEMIYKNAIVYVRPQTVMKYIFNDTFRSTAPWQRMPTYS